MDKKRFKKIYIEISNVCNLACAFCPGTKREKRVMSPDEFSQILHKVSPFADYIYFHIMGEPLCHPNLKEFFDITAEHGLKVIITTNGTLLSKKKDILLGANALHKINISLHAFEANDLNMPFADYISNCFEFGKTAEGKKYVVYRLWNSGGLEELNCDIMATMEKYFPKPWAENWKGTRIGDGVYLHTDNRFDWPDMEAENYGDKTRCMALIDQIGVLADGSVVPCCLDHEGDITLGNIFESSLDEILESDRAKAIYNGFRNGCAVEPLCQRCGYAHKKFG